MLEFRSDSFNSIVVRLKAGPRIRGIDAQIEFQFHSGSIKSRSALMFRNTDVAFQFHSGSIKSVRIIALGQAMMCFNSIVVRLKARLHARRWPRLDLFQFHSGSIKRRNTHCGSTRPSQFQFHSGSIKREPA